MKSLVVNLGYGTKNGGRVPGTGTVCCTLNMAAAIITWAWSMMEVDWRDMKRIAPESCTIGTFI